MKKWKRITAFLLVLVMTLSLLTGCQDFVSDEEGSQGETEPENTSYELVIGHINSENHTWHKMAEKFKELVEEKTEGKVLVTIYVNCALGSEVDMIQEAIAGTGLCDIVFTGETMQSYAEELGIIGMPYAVTSEEHLEAILNGEVGEEISSIMQEQGLRSLGAIVRGNRYVTANKKIKTPEDLEDFVIRTPESTMTVATFEAFGAKTIPLAFSEIYTSIESGLIDGQENTLANIYDAELYEVQDYVIETEHMMGWVYFAISEARFSSFPEEIQTAIAESAEEAVSYEHALFLEEEEMIRQDLTEKGMKFVKVDRETFKEQALEGVIGTLTDKQKELYEKIVEADPDYVPATTEDTETTTEIEE